MANERFKPIPRHADNTSEIISAEHVNVLAGLSEEEQKQRYLLQDVDFKDRALFVLENHPDINTMWMDDFSDDTKIDLSTLTLAYDENTKAITFPSNSVQSQSIVYSKTYVTRYESEVSQVILMVDDFVPSGCSIKYEVTCNNIDWHTITPGDSNILDLGAAGRLLKLRATMTRADVTQFPRLDAWALLFVDPKVGDIDTDTSVLVNADKIAHQQMEAEIAAVRDSVSNEIANRQSADTGINAHLDVVDSHITNLDNEVSTINTVLEGKVDVKDVGNGADQIPILDNGGVLALTTIPNTLTGKSADQVDGHDAGNGPGNVLVIDSGGHVPKSNINLIAADIPITDAGGIFTATDTEGALQEMQGKINGHHHTGNDGDGGIVSYSSLSDKPTTMPPAAHGATHAHDGSDPTPPHATEHAPGGSDPLNLATFGGVDTTTFTAKFDTSTGHDHDGADSKRIEWASINNKPSTFPAPSHASSHATGGTDVITPGDIGAVPASNFNHSAIGDDQKVRHLIICTSTTRPATAETGQHIYETDTHSVKKNDGTLGAPVWNPVSADWADITNKPYVFTPANHVDEHAPGGVDAIDPVVFELMGAVESRLLPTASEYYRLRFVKIKGDKLQAAVVELAITNPATASGDVTVTLGGTSTNIAVTAGDSANTVASKIRAGTYITWVTSGGNNTVVFTMESPGPEVASVNYSAGTTGATGTIGIETQGSTSSADGLYFCKKDASDNYSWIQLV